MEAAKYSLRLRLPISSRNTVFKIYYQLPLLAVLALFHLPLFAQPETTGAVQSLAMQLQAMESLQAKFQQTIRDGDAVVLQQASGTLSVKRPRRFLWRTDQPYEHLVVTDGITLWLYDIDLEQITRQAFNADLDRAPALLLSGEIEEIGRQYRVRALPSASNEKGFELTPRTGGGVFSTLSIVFKGGKLASMSFTDSFDQLTSIIFADVAVNLPLADTLFLFTPPPGIDVIDNDAALNVKSTVQPDNSATQ